MNSQRLLRPISIAVVAGCADPAGPRDPIAASPDAVVSSANATGTPVRLTFPGESPGPPSYSELAPDFVFHTDRDAAIVFWRSPACIPGDFNLLQNLDLTPAFPGGPPRSFVCPLTVEGISWWHDPATDPFPYQVQVEESGAVPIWFFAWSELEPAVADGTLTISELAGFLSLRIGHASFYRESIRNSNQGNRHASSSTAARGMLVDGGSFRLHVSEKLQDGERRYLSVQIEFGGS
ncbi:MAG TPA: hypothetical protein VM094_03375 [Gemmatimonadales bacterium]|nr:hypothetical protein [Gemmatimonadales bacterium]